MNILLIEPDRLLAKTYTAALQAQGHAVVAVPTAQTAITAADVRQPDAVILELQLVEHSGIEFLYEFRSYTDWQTIPVIIHSLVPPSEFHGSQDILQNELYVVSYLYKPRTSLSQLCRALDELAVTPA